MSKGGVLGVILGGVILRLDRIVARVAGEQYCSGLPMNCRQLGNRGPAIPILGMGGQNVFSMGTFDEARKVFRACIDAGVRYVDTAYSYAKSQDRLGRLFAEGVPELFVATKSTQRERDDFLRELDESIELLGRTPDLLHVHAVSKGQSQEVMKHGGALEAANEARDRGLCQFVGITSHDDPQACEEIVRFGEGVDVAMVAISAGDTRFLDGFVPLCRSRGVGVVAMKIMGRGQLVRPDGPGAQSGAQALRFALSQPVSLAIVGFSYPSEVSELAEEATDFQPMTGPEMRDLVDGTIPYSQDVLFYRDEVGDWDSVKEMRPSPEFYEEGL